MILILCKDWVFAHSDEPLEACVSLVYSQVFEIFLSQKPATGNVVQILLMNLK